MGNKKLKKDFYEKLVGKLAEALKEVSPNASKKDEKSGEIGRKDKHAQKNKQPKSSQIVTNHQNPQEKINLIAQAALI
jgi:hypothetical protein